MGKVVAGIVVEGACPSQERIGAAATPLGFSPGVVRRTRRGTVQLEQRLGS